jgi:hypothetical protein
MKITYVIYNDWNKSQQSALASLGFNIETGYNRIDIEKNLENLAILNLIDSWGIQKFVGTTFEKSETENAALLVYVGVWENGYPMPDSDGVFKSLTYDLTEYCPECGIGKKQKSPFRLKRSPKWGSKLMFELNWIYDEVFVEKAFYEKVFKKFGLDYDKVLLVSNDSVIDNTIQLKIPFTNAKLNLENHPFEICGKCKRKKFNPQIEGFFPSFEETLRIQPIFKSHEFFGTGAEAHNKIFIARDLYKELKGFKLKPNVIPVG